MSDDQPVCCTSKLTLESLSVTVLSSAGQPVTGASVAIRCEEGGVSRQATTDNTGRFQTSLEVELGVLETHGYVLECALGVPNTDNVNFRLTTSIGFVLAGQTGPVHFLTIREATP